MDATLPFWLDLLLAALLLAGAAFALVGAWGLTRLPTFAMRLHGPTKASTLGVGSALLASMLVFAASGSGAGVHELLITLFVFMTAPVAGMLLAKAALKLDPASRPPPPPASAGATSSTPQEPAG